ncbi:MAG TPA: hypothetical protein VNE83_02145 [Terriglobales bacterium]|nr:hypothetical protein [Terriglobales bacterium]
MKIFNSIGHFFAWVLDTGLPKATVAVQEVETAAASPLASAIASLLGSKGAAVQSGLQAIAGDVLSAFGDAGAAIGAAGLNVQFDAATVTAIKAIYGDLGSLFGKGQAS